MNHAISEKLFYIYIMTNLDHTVLYTGVTNNLQRRVLEHKTGKGSIFTKKYKLCELVYYEVGGDIRSAINREKEIKAGSRTRKIELINSINPEWEDLYKKYFG